MDRLDLEVRVYLTGRPDGTLEWQAVLFEPDGQTSWLDGGVSPSKVGTPVLPSRCGRAVSLGLRRAARAARSLQFG